MAKYGRHPKTGALYRISDDGKNRLHVYGTKGKPGYRVARMPRPKGYLFNPKNASYYKVKESKGGLTRQHVYQSGRVVNAGPGSAFRKSGIPASYYNRAMNTWNVTNQPSIDTLTKNRGRERSAQDQAYRQIAGYYSDLGRTTTDLMGQVGQVGQQTDAQVRMIGEDRNTQIRQATPRYDGPLGQVAQRMADGEEQAALNRGASADAANRTYGAQVSGSRQALSGQVGAGQAVAGQERLSLLKGQGNQALLSYTDKINEIEGQKPAKVLDTARQLQYDDQALGVKQYEAETDRRSASQRAAAETRRLQIAQQNADSNRIRATRPPRSSNPKSKRLTLTQNNSMWNTVEAAKAATVTDSSGKTRQPTYAELRSKYGEVVANVVRALRHTKGKGITPYANSILNQRGYWSSGYYPVIK